MLKHGYNKNLTDEARKNQRKLKKSLQNENSIEFITLKNGATIAVNPKKRFIKQKPYKSEELQNHLMRNVLKWSVGEDKYNQMVAEATQRT